MSSTGVAVIKPEFIIHNNTREVTLDCISEKDKEKLTEQNDDGPPEKMQRLSKQEKKKLRGQNKGRPAPFKIARETQLCHVLIDVSAKDDVKTCTNPNCKFLHDVQEYLKIKPKDAGEKCYLFNKTGRCPRGITCRFGSEHITEDGYNKIDKEKYEKCKDNKSETINNLNYDLVIQLRKRSYDFSKTQKAIAKDDLQKKLANEAQQKIDGSLPSDKTETGDIVTDPQTKTSGTVTDEDIIKLRSSEKKKIDWKDKLYLSPLTTVGNLPFRRICKEFGADITCGEMAMCSSLLQGLNQEWALVKKHESENLFGVQLCGNNVHTITKTAQLLQENTEIDFVDINLGCPIDLVYREGAGSGLLRRTNVLGAIVRCASDVLDIPLTVKTRTGVYSNQSIAHNLVPKFKSWGASLITVHGRSREQRYTKLADWSYINECAALADPIPVFGNGDILSYDDYVFVKENYKNVSGVMIGRGALIKPWIFTEIKEQKLWDISSSERFDILKKYTNYGLEHWGTDTKGIENTRRFLLEWLSFLYRYIPVGILEKPPQKINERPPTFKGRDDLETLMASPSCSDWIKISEMLLGPVPEKFQFLPKHKANSYK